MGVFEDNFTEALPRHFNRTVNTGIVTGVIFERASLNSHRIPRCSLPWPALRRIFNCSERAT